MSLLNIESGNGYLECVSPDGIAVSEPRAIINPEVTTVDNIVGEFEYINISESDTVDILVTNVLIENGDMLTIIKQDDSIHEIVASGITGTGPYSMDTSAVTIGEIPFRVFKTDEKIFINNGEVIKEEVLTNTSVSGIVFPIPALTSGDDQGYIVTSTKGLVAEPAWKLFNGVGVSGTYTTTTYPGSGEVVLELPTPKAFVGYDMTSRPIEDYNPNYWLVHGSHDGISWIELDSQLGISWSTSVQETKRFEFSNGVAYKYYKYTHTNAINNYRHSFSGLDFFENLDNLKQTKSFKRTIVDTNNVETKVELSTVGNKMLELGYSLVIDKDYTPTITLTSGSNIEVEQGAEFIDPGFLASDVFGNDITNDVIVDNQVDVNILGTYVVTYSVTDKNGFTASITRNVRIVVSASVLEPLITIDETNMTHEFKHDILPTLTLLGEDLITVYQGMTFDELGAVGISGYGEDISSLIVKDDSSVDLNTAGDYSITYNLTDVHGNEAIEVVKTIRVLNTENTLLEEAIVLNNTNIGMEFVA